MISHAGWKVHTQRNWDTFDTTVYITHSDPWGKKRSVVHPFVLTDVAFGAKVEPTIDGYNCPEGMSGDGFLEAVAQAAWDNGWRPHNFKDHQNELSAVRYHLEDMRKLAKVK